MHPIHTLASARKATTAASLALVSLTLLAAACSDATAPDLSTPVHAPIVPSFGKSSSGGARIAFVSDGDTPFGSEIYTVNPDGTGVTRLTFTVNATNTSPAWSPDRKRIAFMSTRTDGLGEIYVMNADGSYLTRLTYSVGADVAPAWSHDGKRIAFASSRDGDIEIYVMNADGSDQRRVTFSPGSDEAPAWSPDGKRIAFVSRRQDPASSTAELYVMNADGTNPTPVTALSEILAAPTWLPGGKQIAFSDANSISVIGVDGTGLTPVIADGVDPTYSPDGKSIAFTSSRTGTFEIYTANADGSAQTRITFENGSSYRPAWGR